MKAKIGLGLLAVLLWSGMAFAVGGKGYYNLVSITTESAFSSATTMVLSQGELPCTSADWNLEYNGYSYSGNGLGAVGLYTSRFPFGLFSSFTKAGDCLASVEDTPQLLHDILDSVWIAADEGLPLALASDLDLGEFTDTTKAGTCLTNHVPLPMKKDTEFNGNGFTVRHLCYAASVTGESPMETPVGFFKTAEYVTIKNVKQNGVRIYIDGESSDGGDYYPVGALVGSVNMVHVDSVTLANDSIQAPFAGGLVGFVSNSTISNISGDDDIHISNKVTINDGYAGSKAMSPVSDYQVFLGGLVGAAYRSENDDPTFENDSVKVDVHDYTTGHKSALGGVAGLFSTTGESIVNVQVYTKYKTSNEVIPSKISGGSAMGGLFGVKTVYVENNSARPGDFTMTGVRFDGLIYDAAPTAVVAVGGLIGLDSSLAGMTERIVNGLAKVDIADSLKVAGNYRYYAGGLLGYGSSCISSSGDGEDFLTIKESRTVGSIEVAASAAAVEGLHGQVYLGGIAATACLAQTNGFGLSHDTSSVKISARVKTAVDNGKMFNGKFSHDSLFVGGLLGFANVAIASKPDTLDGLYFTGSIAVEDSLNNTFIGGIIGGFTQNEGGKSLYFKSVAVNTDTVVSYRAKGSAVDSDMQAAKIGGLCGMCNEISTIEQVGIKGVIDVSGAYAGDSLLVGGLVGETRANIVNSAVKNSFVNGNIVVTATAGDEKTKKTGYLFGSALFSKSFAITSNYHYGENDTDLGPFGLLSTNKDITKDWKVSDSIRYVIRNGADREYTPMHHNGLETEAEMKSSSFAGFLNGAYNDDKEYVWTFVKGKNGDLPIFADSKNLPIVPEAGTFVVTFIADRDSSTIKQQSVERNSAATPPDESEMPEFEGYSFSGNWDKEFNDIIGDLTVTALYDINVYTVKFLDYDKSELGNAQSVKYLETATVPESPERAGYLFVGWDDSSYTEVKKDLEIHAVYKAKKFWIVFRNYDGSVLEQDSIAFDSPVSEPVGLTRAATAEYEYRFVKWDPALAPVSEDAVYMAVYDSTKVKYPVVFMDADGRRIGDTLWVEYGGAATAPDAPEREGYTFVKWDRNFDSVTGSLVVMASYEKIPESSSSEEPSSSESVSSSSEAESSSSEIVESSSSIVEESSSSEEPASSSSRGELKIVKPVIEQSGNSVRLTFKSENATEETTARVVIRGENGIVLDTVIGKSVIDGGVWEMTPAPMGRFTVSLTLGDQVQVDSCEREFEVASEILVLPESWQMVSLSAMDHRNLDDGDASYYWWDEQNPVGDYWQYRAFSGGETPATRGFWYGTTSGNPLVLREGTGARDSEIVWEMDSLYSGWNLVANPYGWYVDLSKGASDDSSKVTFWRWNPASSEYEMPSVLGPYEAVWAKVSHALTWRVSAAPVYGISERPDRIPDSDSEPLRKTAAAKATSGGWAIVVKLSDDYGKTDSWNVIGAGSEESLEEPPAGMGNRVTLSIREQGDKGAKLAKSIKAIADEYEWTLDMSASTARDGKLTFEGIAELQKAGIKLFVTADGKTVELRDGEAFPVALAKSARQVNVRVASSNAVVAATRLDSFRALVADDFLLVNFDVPENLAGANAAYAIVGVDGKKVSSGSFKAAAGVNRFTAKAPKSGIYFVRIRVGSKQLSGKVLVK